MSVPQSIFNGEVYETKCNGSATVLEYRNSGDVLIRFEDTGHIMSVLGNKLRSGYIKDKTRLSIYGVGCLGEGEFETKDNKQAFRNFQNMYQRCYSDTYQKNSLRGSYHGATVSNEWKSFQDFVPWHDENYVEGYVLDKDWIVEDNKIYSPNLACYIPSWLNNLILKNDSRRSIHGMGVEKIRDNCFLSFIKKDGVKVRNGRFKTAIEAESKTLFAKANHIIDCSYRKDVPYFIIEPMRLRAQKMIEKSISIL